MRPQLLIAHRLRGCLRVGLALGCAGLGLLADLVFARLRGGLAFAAQVRIVLLIVLHTDDRKQGLAPGVGGTGALDLGQPHGHRGAVAVHRHGWERLQPKALDVRAPVEKARRQADLGHRVVKGLDEGDALRRQRRANDLEHGGQVGKAVLLDPGAGLFVEALIPFGELLRVRDLGLDAGQALHKLAQVCLLGGNQLLGWGLGFVHR